MTKVELASWINLYYPQIGYFQRQAESVSLRERLDAIREWAALWGDTKVAASEVLAILDADQAGGESR